MQNGNKFNEHQHWLGVWHFFFPSYRQKVYGFPQFYPVRCNLQMKLCGQCHFAAGNHIYITTFTRPCRQGLTKNDILIVIPNQPSPKRYFKFHLIISSHCGHMIMSSFHNLVHPEIYNKINKSGLKTPETKKGLKLYCIMRTRLKSGGGDNNNDRTRA